ncbi:hypothetical protein Fmac_021116 [Flemingia macrophylla]|uniref:GTP-eEF1A C-terminal domain-containing protein n=1 Tax=Flemingia macrophylla TaxID=520843 RepID=A0ABD1LVY8_9FABA
MDAAAARRSEHYSFFLCRFTLRNSSFHICTVGYKVVLHIHYVVEECEIVELLHPMDPKTKKPMKKKVLFVKNGVVIVCRVQEYCMPTLEENDLVFYVVLEVASVYGFYMASVSCISCSEKDPSHPPSREEIPPSPRRPKNTNTNTNTLNPPHPPPSACNARQPASPGQRATKKNHPGDATKS